MSGIVVIIFAFFFTAAGELQTRSDIIETPFTSIQECVVMAQVPVMKYNQDLDKDPDIVRFATKATCLDVDEERKKIPGA